jgi:hypothetical protein
VDASRSALPVSPPVDAGKAVVDALALASTDAARLDALFGTVVLAVCAGEGVAPQACPLPSVIVRLAASTGVSAAGAAVGVTETPLLLAGLPLATFVSIVAACGAAGGIALVVTLVIVLRSRAARAAGAKVADAGAAPRLARRLAAKVGPAPVPLQPQPEGRAPLPERLSGLRQAWAE